MCGLLPAFRVARADVNDLLKGNAATGSGPGTSRVISWLVTLELGFALPLLVVAGAQVRTAWVAKDVLRVANPGQLLGDKIEGFLPTRFAPVIRVLGRGTLTRFLSFPPNERRR